MTAHRCPDCRCADDAPHQPATSSPAIRRIALEAAAAAVRDSQERRTVAARHRHTNENEGQ